MSERFEAGKAGKGREGPPRICVVPCSGIGKSYGSVTREAAYVVVEELRPGTAQIVPLSLLVLGDEDAQAAVRAAQVITLDGCKLACASVNVRQAGGTVAKDFTVLDVFRRNKTLKPQGISELNGGGEALARAMAVEVAQAAEALAGQPDAQGGGDA
jgi:uncharacterized metal-binding protein